MSAQATQAASAGGSEVLLPNLQGQAASGQAEPGAQAAGVCPTPMPGTEVHAGLGANGASGYCFLTPEGFEPLSGDMAGYTTLLGPARGDGPEAPRASLTITTLEAAGLPLDQFVQREIEQSSMGLAVSSSPLFLGEDPAMLVEGLPGQVPTRVIYTSHNGVIYYLLFAPLEPALPEATADMQALYEAVVATWSYQ